MKTHFNWMYQWSWLRLSNTEVNYYFFGLCFNMICFFCYRMLLKCSPWVQLAMFIILVMTLTWIVCLYSIQCRQKIDLELCTCFSQTEFRYVLSDCSSSLYYMLLQWFQCLTIMLSQNLSHAKIIGDSPKYTSDRKSINWEVGFPTFRL